MYTAAPLQLALVLVPVALQLDKTTLRGLPLFFASCGKPLACAESTGSGRALQSQLFSSIVVRVAREGAGSRLAC